MLKRVAIAATLLAAPAFAQDDAATPDPAATPASAQDDPVTVSHGYSNFGELKYGPDEPFAYVNLDAPKGGEISFATLATFDSFNQYSRKGVTEPTASTIVYETLMVAAADDPFAEYCYICTTVEYPESLDWVVFNLREDVTFSDGTPMTAEDVVFSANLLLEQGIPEFRNAIGNFYSKIEMTGPYQVRFEFGEDADMRSRVGQSGAWPVWSKAWFEKTGSRLDEAAERPFLGTGPYVLDRVDMGRSVTYAKDPDWWGGDLPINRGRDNFDRIRIEAFLDQTAAMEAFKAGEYTFRSPADAKEWANDYDFPAVQRGQVLTEALPDGNITDARGFAFNLRREKWQDPKVRAAIEMMFNFEWSNATLFDGLYQRPSSFWGRSDLAAEGVPTEGELALLQPLVDEGALDASILTDEAWMPTVNDASGNTPSRQVRRAAQRLLQEAGWNTGSGGMVRNEAGGTLDLEILQFDSNLDRVMNPFIANLRDIGIDARLRRVDTSQYVELRRNGDWDLANILPGQGFEPGTGLEQWFGSETAGDSSRNIMALADPAVDDLIDTIIAVDNLDDLRDSVRALDRVLRAYGWWIPQWENAETWVAYWDQYRHPDALPPLAVGVLDFWWYDEDAAAALREAGALR